MAAKSTKARCPERGHTDCLISWYTWGHLHGGSDSRNLYCWKMLQRSKRLPVGLRVIFSMRWNEEKEYPFVEDGDAGSREDQIDRVIRRMSQGIYRGYFCDLVS